MVGAVLGPNPAHPRGVKSVLTAHGELALNYPGVHRLSIVFNERIFIPGGGSQGSSSPAQHVLSLRDRPFKPSRHTTQLLWSVPSFRTNYRTDPLKRPVMTGLRPLECPVFVQNTGLTVPSELPWWV